MARPPPERLRLATYPWSRETEPRFGDMDALRHLNNVAIARLYEDARVRFTDACGFRGALERGHGMMVAEVAIQYLAQGHYPDPLTVGCGIGRIGTSSFGIAQGLFQRGVCIGTAETTLVHVDRREGRAMPFSEAGRTALANSRLTPAPDPAATP